MHAQLKKRIMQLEIDFQKNCNEEKGFLLFSREELEGVPEEVVKGFEEVDGKLKVTHKTPDYVPIMCVSVSLSFVTSLLSPLPPVLTDSPPFFAAPTPHSPPPASRWSFPTRTRPSRTHRF